MLKILNKLNNKLLLVATLFAVGSSSGTLILELEEPLQGNFSERDLAKKLKTELNVLEIRFRDALAVPRRAVLQTARECYDPQVGRTMPRWMIYCSDQEVIQKFRVGVELCACNALDVSDRSPDNYTFHPNNRFGLQNIFTIHEQDFGTLGLLDPKGIGLVLDHLIKNAGEIDETGNRFIGIYFSIPTGGVPPKVNSIEPRRATVELKGRITLIQPVPQPMLAAPEPVEHAAAEEQVVAEAVAPEVPVDAVAPVPADIVA